MAHVADIVTLPSHWGVYLVNGDASALDDGEAEAIDAYVARHLPDGAHVVDIVEGSDRFTWSFALYGGNAQGGDVSDFTILTPEPVPMVPQPVQQAQGVVSLGGRYVALADGGVEWVPDAPAMPSPSDRTSAHMMPLGRRGASGTAAPSMACGSVPGCKGATVEAYRILPYSADATATAAQWLAYVDACADGLDGPDADDARREALDKAERRGAILPDAAACLAEILALS